MQPLQSREEVDVIRKAIYEIGMAKIKITAHIRDHINVIASMRDIKDIDTEINDIVTKHLAPAELRLEKLHNDGTRALMENRHHGKA
jgi:hypothetical protein